MPYFDYVCPVCGASREEMVKSAESVVACGSCGSIMNKQVSAPAFFWGKGEGFFKKSATQIAVENSYID